MGAMLILFIIGIIVLGGIIGATLGLVHLALYLAVAGIVGWIADAVVPGKLPYGWLGTIGAGLLGSWLGVLLLGAVGPAVLGIHLLPAIIGAIILTFLASILLRSSRVSGI